MSEQPDHELEILEDDQTVPPRPEELIADAGTSPASLSTDQPATDVAGATPNAD
ncbi:hypothetical protein GCM10027053_22700 [Intrasporangium mesophilum]